MLNHIGFRGAIVGAILSVAEPALAVGLPGGPAKVRRRHAIVAVADHPLQTFESWQGPGLSSVTDLFGRLDEVSAHWTFLSGGREELDWSLVRIVLPEPVEAESYGGDLTVFRHVVADLVREHVDPTRYDADRDGVLDHVFVVVANHGAYFPWVGRGARPDNGAWQWVETQDAPTLLNNAPGEITHEFAMTLGVHDLVGVFDTVGPLSAMSHRWARPPADFTAVERARLGWLRPRVLGPGSHRVRLVHDATVARVFDAVRIESARPDEFFLIEHHQQPRSGFGSNGPFLRGVLVHHVLRGSNQNFDPPFHKIEPADGTLTPGGAGLDASDLFTPENAPQYVPVVMHSYAAMVPVLRVESVEADGPDALVVSLTVFPPSPRANLLHNGAIERGTLQKAESWQADAWTPTSSFFRDRWRPYQGRFSASIKSVVDNDARWTQGVSGLEQGAPYLLCGALRGRAVTRDVGVEVGGNLSVLGMGWFDRSEDLLFGDFSWRRVCYPFRAPSTSATVACRLGFYSSLARGQLWCDELSLEQLKPVFSPPQ
jgi:hypothetical protein